MLIKIDDLSDGAVLKLLEEHLADMHATSPAESVHALDAESLKHPDVTFFSAWLDEELLGCVAFKRLTSDHIELKSMRTSSASRKTGVATRLLTYVLDDAYKKGYRNVSLETGTQAFFKPARSLYEKFGFKYCQPFGDYKEDPNSCFMTKELIVKL